MRPLLLHRYVLVEFLPPFAVGLLVFTFLLILSYVFPMADLFLNRGVELATIFKMVGLVLPMLLPLSIPMASLLAALSSYGRFSEDGELTALRSAGCTLFQYTWPNILLGLLFSLILVQFNLNVAPRARQAFEDLHYAVARQNPLALFAPKVMNHFGEYKIIVDKMDRRKKKLSGVSIYKMNPEGAPTRILAPEGEILPDAGNGLTIKLANGAIHQPSHDKESQYTITKFNGFALRIPAKMEKEPRTFSPREMTYAQLQKKIGQSEAGNLSAAGWKTEKNLRIAIAFSPFVFIMLGTVLGVRLKKGSKSMSVGMSLVVILLYYGLFVLMVSLSSQGILSSFLLTWFPNALTLAAGAFFWRRLARQ